MIYWNFIEYNCIILNTFICIILCDCIVVASGPCQLDLCIVMDLYDGVLPQNWDKTLDFLDDVVVGLNIGGSGTRVSDITSM